MTRYFGWTFLLYLFGLLSRLVGPPHSCRLTYFPNAFLSIDIRNSMKKLVILTFSVMCEWELQDNEKFLNKQTFELALHAYCT